LIGPKIQFWFTAIEEDPFNLFTSWLPIIASFYRTVNQSASIMIFFPLKQLILLFISARRDSGRTLECGNAPVWVCLNGW
jgi:hypothetical protein